MGRSEASTPNGEGTESMHPSRRKILGAFLTVGGVGATSIGLRMPERTGEYLSAPHDPLRLIFGSHNLPEGYGGNVQEAVYNPYLKNGDLNVSIWPNGPLQVIDRGMRHAKRMGHGIYMLSVDGNDVYSPRFEVPFLWPTYPHPDRFQQNDYPDDIVMVHTEYPQYFGLDLVQADSQETSEALMQLTNDLSARYNYYTKQTQEAQSKTQEEGLVISLGEAVGTTVPVIFGTNLIDRRHFSKMIAAGGIIGGIQFAKGVIREGDLSSLIGHTSNYREQQLLTELQSVTDVDGFGNYLDQWTEARTAMAIEKVKDARMDVAQQSKIQATQIPADILYGSAHSVDAPEIVTDSNYRKRVIQGAARELLGTIDMLINTKYKSLASGADPVKSYRDIILLQAASSLTLYSYGDLHYPWRVKSIHPSDIQPFENSLLPHLTQKQSPVVTEWINEVLHEFDSNSQASTSNYLD